ncbi:GNAT family N-acetyltransferase [Roseomonas fluvialis]|uniref:N-acetyltransferase n=1 Tax=Roseomonas fluvialis TaxID=1750527 RepID=A0ABM7Y040_9PROT|nr:GNAT family N-acetyltransferase [Roseomonas fluvialis]BDG71104.1 N-acetyltransferase [Roseomonas fluvialis]
MRGDSKVGGGNSPEPPPFSGTPPAQTGSAIRRATPDDARALKHLIAQLNRDQGDPDDLLTDAHVERDIIGNPSTIAMVAQGTDGALIGYATAHATYETGHAEHGLYVADLYTSPTHRRRGIARALLAGIARAGHAQGARHLWLTAKAQNTAAHAFYRRLGSRGEAVMAFAVVQQDFLNLAAEPPP